MKRRNYLQSVGGLALTPALTLTDARTGAGEDELTQPIRVWEGHYQDIQIIHVQIPEQVDAEQISIHTEETSETHDTDEIYQSRKSKNRDDSIYSFLHQSRTKRVEVDGGVQSIGGFSSPDSIPPHLEIVFGQDIGQVEYFSIELSEESSASILSYTHALPDDAEGLFFELEQDGEWVEYPRNIVQVESDLNGSTTSFKQLVPSMAQIDSETYRSADGLRAKIVNSDGSVRQIPLFFEDAEESA